MFHNLKKKLRFARFDIEIKAILDTPAIKLGSGADIVCVSHIGRTYLSAYLLAIKSLARWVPLRKVIIIDDLSLTDSHRALLREHIPGVEVRPITSIANKACPSGGDWEGFLLIGEEAKDSYCILLDADTVATGSLPEVADSIASNKSFTLGTWKNQQIVSVTEAYEYVKSLQSNHVQIVAERSLHNMNNASAAKYVRGCGGFAGFAKGKEFRRAIEEFSQMMGVMIGEAKWKEWGSQQVASNYIVANTPGSMVLPFPKYASYAPGLAVDETAFIHFIGSHRFEDGAYSRVAREVIRQLLAPG